jgi:hypothetical protein
MKSEEWAAQFNRMPVTGHCDAGCGKKATVWFGLTSCATCGDSACVNVLQDSYDREGERPDFGHVQPQTPWPRPSLEHELHDAQAKIAGLEEWVDNLQGQNAALVEQLAEACAALAALQITGPKVWPEGTTDKQIRHYLLGPLRLPKELPMTDDKTPDTQLGGRLLHLKLRPKVPRAESTAEWAARLGGCEPSPVDPGPTRVPDDIRARGYVPVVGTIGPDEFDDFEARKRAQLDKLTKALTLLETANTCSGASLMMGIARGRLGVLRDLGLVSADEYDELRAAFMRLFNARWPDLHNDEPPERD